jgi:hypothetical protein
MVANELASPWDTSVMRFAVAFFSVSGYPVALAEKIMGQV